VEREVSKGGGDLRLVSSVMYRMVLAITCQRKEDPVTPTGMPRESHITTNDYCTQHPASCDLRCTCNTPKRHKKHFVFCTTFVQSVHVPLTTHPTKRQVDPTINYIQPLQITDIGAYIQNETGDTPGQRTGNIGDSLLVVVVKPSNGPKIPGQDSDARASPLV